MKKKPIYETEAALCADFIAWVKRESGKFRHGEKTPVWTSYAETKGWDILLVADDGTQIGVQAKLRFNLKVLEQTIPDCWDSWSQSGPDYRAVLVPDNGYARLCNALGLILFYPRDGWRSDEMDFGPGLVPEYWNGGWHHWWPAKRHTLPEYVPDVIAGASGPVQLTKWKVSALRLVAALETRGYITRADFAALRIDPRRWVGPHGWLIPGARKGEFVAAPSLQFHKQHPEVYAQILAETRAKLIVDAPADADPEQQELAE